MENNIIHALKELHTAAIDARNGYQEALDDAKGRGLSPLFARMIALHAQNADELRQALIGAGELADGTGSFMSAVHEAIMDIRSLFGGLGESVLPGLIDGEKRNIARYDEALKATWQVASPVRDLLAAQRERLAVKVAAMKAEREDLKAQAS
jgi:uncharacterized protein (TIGR02284 family)